jgi:hypothetical protein
MAKGKGGTVDSQCAAAWSATEATKDVIFSGSSSGEVVMCQGGAITKTYPNCKGSVHSIVMRVDKKDGELALVGETTKLLLFISMLEESLPNCGLLLAMLLQELWICSMKTFLSV